MEKKEPGWTDELRRAQEETRTLREKWSEEGVVRAKRMMEIVRLERELKAREDAEMERERVGGVLCQEQCFFRCHSRSLCRKVWTRRPRWCCQVFGPRRQQLLLHLRLLPNQRLVNQ